MNNEVYKIKPEIININTNEPVFYPYSIKINKCKGSCNTNKRRHIKWYKTCKCRCIVMQVSVTINKGGMKKNVDVNVKN